MNKSLISMNRMLLRETRMGSKRLKYEFPGYTVNNQVQVILFASIAHTTHVLLVRSICRTNKMEFFVVAVISGCTDGVLG